MPDAEAKVQLQQLLQHPALWRGRSVAPLATFATGFAALDQALPGGGWPRTGLIEVLTAQQGIGELQLWLPALAALSRAADPRWCAFIGPPFQLFAPAFAAAGVQLDKLLIVHPTQMLWATEQALLSGACGIVLAWLSQVAPRDLRRLVLATEQAGAPAVIFRPAAAEREASPAALRLAVQATPQGLQLRIVKSRGAGRGVVNLVFGA
jgi:hypothetical protein